MAAQQGDRMAVRCVQSRGPRSRHSVANCRATFARDCWKKASPPSMRRIHLMNEGELVWLLLLSFLFVYDKIWLMDEKG